MVHINYHQVVISRKHEHLAEMIMYFKPDVKVLGYDIPQQAGETNATIIFVSLICSTHITKKANQVTGTGSGLCFSQLAKLCGVVNSTICVHEPQKDKHPLQN